MEWIVVDDSEISRDMAVEILLGMEERALGFASGQAALDYLKTPSGEKTEAILLDYRMPVLDGAETARRIRQAQKEAGREALLIIGMSGDTDEATVRTLVSAGMDDVIGKPLEISRLMEITETYRKEKKGVSSVGRTTSQKEASSIEGEEARERAENQKEDFPWKYQYFDRETGIHYSGNDSLFYKYLNNFTLSYEKIRDRLDSYWRSADLRNFTIEVHALKSTARMLGNLSLSETARQMEVLGDSGATGEIEDRLPQFMEDFAEAYREAGRIRKDHEEFIRGQNTEKTSVDQPEGQASWEDSAKMAVEILNALEEVAEGFDIDSVDRCIEDLKGIKLLERYTDGFKELEELAAEVDYNGVCRRAREIQNIIRKDSRMGANSTDYK